MYYFDDGSSPDNLYYETITPPTAISDRVTDYTNWGSEIAKYPIRVDPLCNYVVTGSGQLYYAATAGLATTLIEQPVDVAWNGSDMYDILPGTTPDTALIHRFDAAYTINASAVTVGSPQRLLSYGGYLYAVTSVDSHTLITKVPAPSLTGNDLSVLPIASTPGPGPDTLGAVEFAFFNQGPSGPASAAISIAIPAQVESISWLCEPAAASDYDCGSDGPLNVNTDLAAGERFTVIGFFTTPASADQSLQFDAAIQATSGGDTVIENNVSSMTVGLDRLFHSGFEQ
jgi:hypothetical protein